jgi:23S rRNA (adenine2030-N6)-methyltransferase
VKYQHSHHAGNFADVHKHVTLLAVLAALTRKEKPFLFVDTHAGRGIYRQHESAQRDGEATQGVERVLAMITKSAPAAVAAPIANYADEVLALRRECRDTSACPGSPWLAARSLRPDDRAAAFELQAAEHSALHRALEYYPQFITDDGFKRLRSLLPPPERRALVLIDPPYEDPRDEPRRVQASLADALRRFPTGVYMVWFPLKTQRDADHWRNTLSAVSGRPLLYAQLAVHPLDSRAGLNGSGLAIVNPPYRLDVEMSSWLPELHSMLDPATQGSSALCMLGGS